ncbi:MAG TPA: radical SAM protein [Dongiaceae bacterium]|nr:radical SAM protein [Dongiaceae bacterium]
MAGSKTGEFVELISPFLRRKMAELEERQGRDSAALRALELQYVKSPLEDVVAPRERRRHYESEIVLSHRGRALTGVERLYRRTVLLEPTTVCAAHCRWCLRGQYPVKTLTEDEIVNAARYFGEAAECAEVDEVLITGGDPLMSPKLLRRAISALQEFAPNIHTIRIGSRVPFQAPERINDELLSILTSLRHHKLEIGVNVNHPVEFWPESRAALARLRAAGAVLYNQHPLLKGVNDNLETLSALYAALRDNEVEAHYLFHAIPMRGMSHHRTSVRKGAELAMRLNASGEFSGRAKPRYALMTDIGKIVLYEGTIIRHRAADNALLLRSGYRPEDRLRWNPSWRIPDSVEMDAEGFMCVWYQDGDDTMPSLDTPAAKELAPLA